MHTDDLMAGTAAHGSEADGDGSLDHTVRPLSTRQRRHRAIRQQPPGDQLRPQFGVLTQHINRGVTLLRARQRLAYGRPDDRRGVRVQRRLDQQRPLSGIVIHRGSDSIGRLGLAADVDRLQTDDLRLCSTQRGPYRSPVHRLFGRPRPVCPGSGPKARQ